MAEEQGEKMYELEWREKFIDGVKHMEEILKGEQFSELHVLDMFYCEIGVDGAKYFETMIKSNPMKSLTELNLSGNALTDEGFDALMTALIAGCLPSLQYLNADDNKLTGKAVSSLSKLIESGACPSLQAISLNLNDIGEDGCVQLAEAIRKSTCPWSKVCLNENHINDNGFNALFDALLPQMEMITEITLSQNGLSTASIDRIGSLMSEGKLVNLVILDLSYNYSTNMLEGLLNGIEAGNNEKLRRLVISGMCLEAEGCNHLRTVLKKKALPGLQELLMAENNIMERGVLAVLLALRETSCPVRLLDLSWNNLTDEGAKYIINFLNGRSKTHLNVMLLNQNDIAYKIIDLQKALNQRGIRSPKLREQWL